MINNKLQSMFDDSKLVTMSTVVANVEVNPSELMETLADETLREMKRVMPYAGYADVEDLETSDILRYQKTLLWMRVQKTMNQSDKSFSAYKALAKYIAVPVVLYQLLIPIGVAYDRDFGIEFRPAYSITEDELLSPGELETISSIMRTLERNGFKMVEGIPASRDGELDFMALSHVKETVLGYRKSHPVYGFLAAFFTQHELNEVTGSMSRIIYGYLTDYRVTLSAVFNALNSNSKD